MSRQSIGWNEDTRDKRGSVMSWRKSKLKSLECQPDALPLEVTFSIIRVKWYWLRDTIMTRYTGMGPALWRNGGKVRGSSLNRDTLFLNWGFSWFYSLPQTKLWSATSLGYRLLPSKSFPVHHTIVYTVCRLKYLYLLTYSMEQGPSWEAS